MRGVVLFALIVVLLSATASALVVFDAPVLTTIDSKIIASEIIVETYSLTDTAIIKPTYEKESKFTIEKGTMELFVTPLKIPIEYRTIITIPYNGITEEKDNRLYLKESGYKLYKGMRCLLENSSGEYFDAPVFKPAISILENYIIASYKIEIPQGVYGYKCIDPLVNETTPVIGYITADGGSGTEVNTFRGNMSNNEIRNFTFISLSNKWSNLTSANYDSLVDVYFIGNWLGSPFNYDITDTERGIVFSTGWGISNSPFELCTNKNMYQTVLVSNITHSVAQDLELGSEQRFTSFKDSSGCSWSDSVYFDNSSRIYHNDGAFGGVPFEDGDTVNGTAIDSRWFLTAINDQKWADIQPEFENFTIRALDWVVTPHEGGATAAYCGCVSGGDMYLNFTAGCHYNNTCSIDGYDFIGWGSGTATINASFTGDNIQISSDQHLKVGSNATIVLNG